MKKTLLALLLFVSVAGLGQKSFYFGVGSYIGSSAIVNQNTYGIPELDYEVPFSYGINLNAGFSFTKTIGIKMEIGNASLGQKYSDTRNDTNFTRDVKLSYLSIPVLFKYNSAGTTARFYILAGPQMMFLIKADQEYLADGEPYERTGQDADGNLFKIGDPDIKDRISSFDLMARIDMGVDITLVKNLVLNAGITMAYGLLDINATAYQIEDYSGNYNPSHNVYGGIGIGICYSIPLKK
jgi:hypothetical protein